MKTDSFFMKAIEMLRWSSRAVPRCPDSHCLDDSQCLYTDIGIYQDNGYLDILEQPWRTTLRPFYN